MDWYGSGPKRVHGDIVRNDLFRAAEVLGPMHIKAGTDYERTDWPLSELAYEFKELCKRAADANTKIALEPQPMAAIRTPHQALQLLEKVDHPAGGLLLDIWHVERGHVPLSALSTIPTEKLFGIELDDAHADVQGTLIEDTVKNRQFLGEGDFNIQGFIRAVAEIGYTGPWGIEIISDFSRKLPMREKVEKAFRGAADQLHLASLAYSTGVPAP
jgi:sugar phosphate isomerase/epimerase